MTVTTLRNNRAMLPHVRGGGLQRRALHQPGGSSGAGERHPQKRQSSEDSPSMRSSLGSPWKRSSNKMGVSQGKRGRRVREIRDPQSRGRKFRGAARGRRRKQAIHPGAGGQRGGKLREKDGAGRPPAGSDRSVWIIMGGGHWGEAVGAFGKETTTGSKKAKQGKGKNPR